MAAAFAAIVLNVNPAAARSQAAPTPSDKCESGKNYASGGYMNCVGKAEKKLILTGDVNAYGVALNKCIEKFVNLWAKYENVAASAGMTCPSEDDGVEIKDFLDSCSQSVSEALAGGSLPDTAACQADLATCQGDLATSEADLSACNASLGTCNADLGTCTTDLSTTEGDLAVCADGLQSCSTAYNECNANMGACATDLGTCTNDLSTCNADLLTCGVDLSTAEGQLATCTGDLGTCNTDLTTCNGDLGTCNTDLGTCTGDLGTCTTDLAACEAQLGVSQPLNTGQTLCYNSLGGTIACAGTGQNGEVQAGAVRSYTDNGNGTITDDVTGLTWEKLSDDGTIHDWDATYNWDAAFTKIASLNSAVFANHSDWRLPDRAELETLSVANLDHPATPAAFNSACAPGCTATTCNCTKSNFYWSSTTYNPSTAMAWVIGFAVGNTNSYNKSSLYYVRAVRGGL